MGAELQELLPSLSVTAAFAVCLVVIARQEDGYSWWKAVIVVLAGALTGLGAELATGLIDSPVLQTVVAVLGLFAVVAAIALPARLWIAMSWRDAVLVGIGYVFAQAAVSIALLYFQDHAL